MERGSLCTPLEWEALRDNRMSGEGEGGAGKTQQSVLLESGVSFPGQQPLRI